MSNMFTVHQLNIKTRIQTATGKHQRLNRPNCALPPFLILDIAGRISVIFIKTGGVCAKNALFSAENKGL